MGRRRAIQSLQHFIERNQVKLTELSLEEREIASLGVILDGGDGTGKTVTSTLVYQFLQNEGLDILVVDEADSDPFHSARQSYKERQSVDPLVLFNVKNAGRREHILTSSSKLKEPGIRLYDRGYGTTLVEYLADTLGNGGINTEAALHFDEVRAAIRRMSGTYRVPDLHVILDCDPETAAARVAQKYIALQTRPAGSERPSILRRRRVFYLTAANYLPNALVIDTTKKTEEEVAEEVIREIQATPRYKDITQNPVRAIK